MLKQELVHLCFSLSRSLHTDKTPFILKMLYIQNLNVKNVKVWIIFYETRRSTASIDHGRSFRAAARDQRMVAFL